MMHPDTRKIADYMKDFGLHVFGRSIVDVVFAEFGNPYSHAMSVVRCAHAAELLLKARIAEEHPLLIFESLPKLKVTESKVLHIDALLNEGRTIMYSDLPDVLWATTGHRVPNLDRFRSFGRLRNAITHLAVPDVDLSAETLAFGFLVVEPLVREFWSFDVVEYLEAYDFDCEEYLYERLKDIGISYARHTKSRRSG